MDGIAMSVELAAARPKEDQPVDGLPGRERARNPAPGQGGLRGSVGEGWGTNGEMNAVEAVMWRADADGVVRSPLLAVEQLDTVPDWDRFLAVHERGVRMVPRLRQRVVEAPLGLGSPRWSVDPEFDLRFHVRRARLPDGGGWPALLEAAARLAMSPFDRARPPWEAVLYEGLPDGRAAYVLKMHHSATDGLGAVQLLSLLHSRRREPDPAESRQAVAPAGQTNGLGVLAHQVRSDVASLPAAVLEAGSAAFGALSNPVHALRSASRYGPSLLRVLAPPNVEGSPLLSGRGRGWRFAALDVPLPQLRAAAKTAGGTVNDAYLAALLGGYRRYHAALGVPVETIPMAMPISMRRPGDPGGGNRITGTRFGAPVGVADPKARIARIRAVALAARCEPAIGSLGLMSTGLARLPGPVSTQIVAAMTKANDLQASFVPGPRDSRYLAGARLERVYPYAPLPGCPAMITLVTHRDVACVGVNFDPVAFTEPELFTDCLLEGFAEVLSLQPQPATPIART
jgi:diacylglycerol O-acyltransferase / wax synthase